MCQRLLKTERNHFHVGRDFVKSYQGNEKVEGKIWAR